MAKKKDPRILVANRGFRLIDDRGILYIDVNKKGNDGLKSELYEALTDNLEYDQVSAYGQTYPVSLLIENRAYLARLMVGQKKRKNGTVQSYYTPFGKVFEDCVKRQDELWKARVAKGVVEQGDLPRLYPPDTVAMLDGPEPVAGYVHAVNPQRSFFGPFIAIQLRVVHAMNGVMKEGIYATEIAGFSGVKKISELPLRKPTEDEKKMLTARGQIFADLHKPGTYISYTGSLIQPSYWSQKEFRADGRAVVDPVSFQRVEPSVWRDCSHSSGVLEDGRAQHPHAKRTAQTIPAHELWRCMPYFYGFSMPAKQWGQFLVSHATPVEFRDKAFDSLVLEPEIKHLVYSLVKYHGNSFTDIVEGKGGGCIFLLHGLPGLGKTATAETVAEEVRRPLYSVSVGELGTDTVQLEANLRKILDVATIWDAVVLLDEADIFLEERTTHDIQRNAMVGVFLRLLEYHNGILFLTTNRVKNIDRAFYSRISVAVHYHHNGAEKRAQIWNNLLVCAGLDPAWSEALSAHDINGRQIKNAIRLSQTLARAAGHEVTLADLNTAAVSSLKFADDLVTSQAAGDEPEKDAVGASATGD